MSEVKRCPVCNGTGRVPLGFYNQTSGRWTTGGIQDELCRSCDGKGYVIVPDGDTAQKIYIDYVGQGANHD